MLHLKDFYNYANNSHILGRTAVHPVQDVSELQLQLEPIINSAVYFSCTVHLLSSIKLVDEPNNQHHSSEGIQH